MKRWLLGLYVCVGIVVAIAILLTSIRADASRISSYALSQEAAFNQPGHFPLQPPPDGALYRPTHEWMGRLILPNAATPPARDWVWIELYQAPAEAEDLIGQTVRLSWGNSPFAQNYPKAVTTDVRISNLAYKFENIGNVIPSRLDNRAQVGPLQSLAGARPNDDVEVALQGVKRIIDTDGTVTLLTEREPVQVTGRYYGLVKILAPETSRPNVRPAICPGTERLCESELYQVQHFNPQTQHFDGPKDVVRIPQQPLDSNDRFLSTPHLLPKSPAGQEGWYIYGAYDAGGMLTVQALKPRSLLRLQPQEVLLGKRQGRIYISQDNWDNTPAQKGSLQAVLIDPVHRTPEAAIADWKEGDQALVIHLFGGIGGEKGEPFPGWTVTGHFAYGLAQVVREPITRELQYDITYQQIYGHNPNAIVAGSLDWTAYMGDLQRGWMGVRPVSDIIIKLDALARPFQLGDTTLSVSILRELMQQTQVMTARYRTGDGTGLAAVTPATSCVQDSSQALFIALERLRREVQEQPEVAAWMKAHPRDPETRRFQRVVELADALNTLLFPRGTVRPDWEQNAKTLMGISGSGDLGNQATFKNALLSWRSIMPRQAHDEVSRILLNAGAQLWFIRTNQVGGWDPTVEPIAPTIVLGQLPIVSKLVNRMVAAFLAPLRFHELAILLLLLGLYAAIALPLGLKNGFLTPTYARLPWLQTGLLLLRLWFLPALLEEFVRILILPHPTEGLSALAWLFWATLSLALYVLYHPANAYTFYRPGYPMFLKKPFLQLCTLLGVALTLFYALTGSYLGLIIFHWLAVVVWILFLGGYSKLHPPAPASSPQAKATLL